jgi:DNA mismatch repair protein MutS2
LIEPTYRFIKGVPGRSYGLDIAERLGLRTDVVEMAREWVPAAHNTLNDLIDEWERKKVELLKRGEEVEKEKARLTMAVSEWEEGREELERELEEKRRKANDEVHDIVLDTRNRMEEIISRLERTSSDEKDKIRNARREVEMKLQEIRENRSRSETGEETGDEREPLHVGDGVEVKSLGDEGTVLLVRGSEYMVKVGNLSISMPRGDLRKIRAVEKGGPVSGKPSDRQAWTGNKPEGYDPEVVQEIDIRGVFADEVTFHVQKAIDSAVLQGIGNIRFIHGKGKGVLREKVAEVLSCEHRVKSFRPGQFGEGGTGVTIATIG